jgi:hypothetical protein
VLRKERALKELARVARAEKRSAADEAEAERLAEKLRRRDDRGERVRAEILPPLPMLPELKIPPDVAPLDFLIALMRQPQLPLGFRRDCAAMALPFAHAKPILGIKDARRLAALDDDDDDDDEIARAMRSN